jgi:hypothetical protein
MTGYRNSQYAYQRVQIALAIAGQLLKQHRSARRLAA